MGAGDVVFPTGNGTIYGFRGEIKTFFPGLTITTHDGKMAYFALVANYGVVYLVGEAIVSRDEQPGKAITLPVK
jgi:hypothetical protein